MLVTGGPLPLSPHLGFGLPLACLCMGDDSQDRGGVWGVG